jgi:uncharacterized membrane protein
MITFEEVVHILGFIMIVIGTITHLIKEKNNTNGLH